MNKFENPIIKGCRILVEVEEQLSKEFKTSMIAIPKEVLENDKLRETARYDIGIVREIGPDAFVIRHAKQPYCIPGSLVCFVAYGGYNLPKASEDSLIVKKVVKDEDIVAVLGHESLTEEEVRKLLEVE